MSKEKSEITAADIGEIAREAGVTEGYLTKTLHEAGISTWPPILRRCRPPGRLGWKTWKHLRRAAERIYLEQMQGRGYFMERLLTASEVNTVLGKEGSGTHHLDALISGGVSTWGQLAVSEPHKTALINISRADWEYCQGAAWVLVFCEATLEEVRAGGGVRQGMMRIANQLRSQATLLENLAKLVQ